MNAQAESTRDILTRVYRDDTIDNPVEVLAKLLPALSLNGLTVRASNMGLARERRERRARLGIGPRSKLPAELREKIRTGQSVPTVRADVVLPWRATKARIQPPGVRPVMCPGCGECFAIPADPRAK